MTGSYLKGGSEGHGTLKPTHECDTVFHLLLLFLGQLADEPGAKISECDSEAGADEDFSRVRTFQLQKDDVRGQLLQARLATASA